MNPPEVQWPVEVSISDAAGTACVDVPADAWVDCVHAAREQGFSYFDWLSAVDQLDADPAHVQVVVHLGALAHPAAGLRRLLIRTPVVAAAHGQFELRSLTGIFAGAAWHERETHEMFGVVFTGFEDGSGAGLRPLLLPDGFEGTPLRKSFVLAARAARPWPGAKDPGESGEGAPSRRKAQPPGVPDPATWGPRDC